MGRLGRLKWVDAQVDQGSDRYIKVGIRLIYAHEDWHRSIELDGENAFKWLKIR